MGGASDRTALDVVRLFATMEMHHYLKSGRYATKEELLNFIPASWIATKKEDPTTRDFFRQLRIGEDEVISGWNLSVLKSDDQLAYFISLVRSADLATKECNSVYVCDQVGIIMVGGPNFTWKSPAHCISASSILGLGYIDDDPILNKKPGLLRKLAFTTLSASAIPETICGCSCTCETTIQCHCWDAGCRSCPFCCADTCGDCAFCGPKGGCSCC